MDAPPRALGEEEREDQSADAVAVGGEGEVGRDWSAKGEEDHVLSTPGGGSERVACPQHDPVPAQSVTRCTRERRCKEAAGKWWAGGVSV